MKSICRSAGLVHKVHEIPAYERAHYPHEYVCQAAAILSNPNNKLATDASGRVRQDPTQALDDVQTNTVMGAWAGMWGLAWGKAQTDTPAKKLKVWGPGNNTGTPSATFTVDNVANPTVRTKD
jgi:hypothetical protein